jgi:spermidine synthase
MPKVEILQQNGYNFLWIDGYLWMWDIPSEVMIEQEMADQCYGDVLVAGYGMGVCQKMLTEKPNVKSVVTIEKYREVEKEYLKVFGKIYGYIITSDFYDYYFPPPRQFDCIVGDVWEEIHPKFVSDYIRFKEHALKFLKPGGKLISWGMDYYEYLIDKGDAKK